MCNKCISKHTKHELIDVSEAAETFRKQLKCDIEKVSACSSQTHDKVNQLETDRNSFIKKVMLTQSEISKKYDQVISLLQLEQSQLMEELNSFKDKILKKIATKESEMERQFVITESFKRYCQEMINKGTACDVSRMVHDLHARAEELVKTQDEPDCHQVTGVEITFKPSSMTIDSIKNLIGNLVFEGQIYLQFYTHAHYS